MSTFLEDVRIAGDDGSLKKNKNTTPLTRLPTVMTRKEPKVKPPPPSPTPPRPDVAEGGQAGQEGEDLMGSGSESGGQYEGMTREQILEEFRAKQAEREAARRKAMDEEVEYMGKFGYSGLVWFSLVTLGWIGLG